MKLLFNKQFQISHFWVNSFTFDADIQVIFKCCLCFSATTEALINSSAASTGLNGVENCNKNNIKIKSNNVWVSLY